MGLIEEVIQMEKFIVHDIYICLFSPEESYPALNRCCNLSTVLFVN